MLFDWAIITLTSMLAIFLFVKMFYFKNLTIKEKKSNDVMKMTLKEAEIMIRKYQIQLQRAIGNIDILNEEMNKLRNDVKTFKARNSTYRIENERTRNKIKELEAKIEALL